MYLNNNIEKDCSVYVSNYHLLAMILPYINRELDIGRNVVTILEQDLQSELETFISKMNLNKNTKDKIMKLNWKKNNEELKRIDSNTDIFVVGKKSYIDNINYKIENKDNSADNMKIINCYNFMEFNNNVTEILNSHDKILNTSGENSVKNIIDNK